MSNKMQALVEDITFGCAGSKGIIKKLADWADDDGGSIFPAVETIARKTETSKRFVQMCLADWRKMKLLLVVRQGGGGPRRTTEYKINLKLVYELLSGKKFIERETVKKMKRMVLKDAQVEENKGAAAAPQNSIRVQQLHHKGAAAAPNPSLTVNSESLHSHTARAREVEEIFPIKELQEENFNNRIIEYFIRPLIDANLTMKAGHDLPFFKLLCEKIYTYSNGALKAAASNLVSTRHVFPTIAGCLEALKDVAPNHGVTVMESENPEAWQAWAEHYRKTGQRWQCARMQNGEINSIQVATPYPPTLKNEVQKEVL